MAEARTLAGRGLTPQLVDLARAAKRGEETVIAPEGERLAAIVDIARYDRWTSREEEQRRVIESVQAHYADEDPDEVMRFVVDEIHKMRAERRRAA